MTNVKQFLDDHVRQVFNEETLHNYVIPGLSSISISKRDGCHIRLFDMNRQQHSDVTPHSHKFDLSCYVLEGHVINRLWVPCDGHIDDPYVVVKHSGELGKYEFGEPVYGGHWQCCSSTFNAGQNYQMSYSQIHSITFSKGAKVLMIEGPKITDTTKILLPASHGVCGPMRVEDWMFKHE